MPNVPIPNSSDVLLQTLKTSSEVEDHPFGHAGPIPVPEACTAYPSGSSPSPGVIDPSVVSMAAVYKACVDHLRLNDETFST